METISRNFQDMLTDKDEELQRATKPRYKREKISTKDIMADYLAGELD